MMNKTIVMLAATAICSFSVQAQSLEEGMKMVKYERFVTAKKILEPLAATDPMANYYLGLAEIGMENMAAAQADFMKYPTDVANMAGLARVAYLTNNVANGQKLAADVAAKATKKDAKPYLYAADAVNYGKGSVQLAIDYYKKAIEKKVVNVDAFIGLGDAYLRETTGGGEAMSNYEKAIELDPKNSLGYSRIGALWYAARTYDKALENYQKAKDADDQNPLPYSDLASAYFYNGKYELANQNIDKYWELSDKSEEDRLRLIGIKFLAKKYDYVISELKPGADAGSIQKPYLYRLLGYAQFETKDYEQALKNMKVFFAKQDPAKVLPSDYTYMAKIFGQLKQADSADFYYAKALELDKSEDKTKLYTEIAESYKAMNTKEGYGKAALYYGKVISASAKPTVTDYFWYGTMSYYAQDYTQAAKIFEETETKFPSWESASYWRGRVAAAQDAEAKTGAALPYYEKWLAAVGPDYDKKKDLLNVYKYAALFNFNKGNKAETQKYLDKIVSIDPNDELAKQIKAASKSK